MPCEDPCLRYHKAEKAGREAARSGRDAENVLVGSGATLEGHAIEIVEEARFGETDVCHCARPELTT